MSDLDKSQIARQFSRAAGGYSSAAKVQTQMADELLRLLPNDFKSPETILDLGCGNGYLTEKCTRKYPDSEIIGLDIASGMLAKAKELFRTALGSSLVHPRLIQGDIEQLPLPSNHYDLVVSNAALQWTDIHRSMAEIDRVLVPGGIGLIATFVEGTLSELHRALEFTGLNLGHPMHSLEYLESSLEELNLHLLRSQSRTHFLTHDSLRDLLGGTKRMGATNAHASRNRGLMSKGSYQRLLAGLNQEFSDSKYFSRYCSGYLVFSKAQQ